MRALGLDLSSGDSRLLVARGESLLSRGDLRRRADALSAQLERDGVSRVLVRGDDPAGLLAAIDACTRRGCDLWIAHTTLADTAVAEVAGRFRIQLLLDRGEPASIDAARALTAPVDPQPPAGRLYLMTSGTTGRPKLATHTLMSLLGRIAGQAALPANRGARWLLTYQPTAFAGIQVMLTAVVSEGAIVAAPEGGIAGMYEAALRHSVTHVSGTPTFWRSFLLVARPGSLPLRQITLGGEAVDQATLDRVQAAFPGARITHIYASTEAGVIFAVHDGKEGFPAEWLETGAQGVGLRIRDGLIEVRSPHRMQGYASGATQPLTEDGWLATGDRAEVQGARVRILGREDAIINVGGAKVYPQVVEAFLLGIAGVTEVKVRGVRNPISGALVAADIVLEAGCDPEAARRHILVRCRENLPSYQVPRVVNFVERIETAASGKKG
jgi:acyl-CoA synthetase (AMP-forming)/AMP-acid ligase II